MSRIAIIANPHARRNRMWPLAAQALRQAAPGALLLETARASELDDAARQIAQGRFDAVAIAGGDGTLQHALTALDRACPGALPPLALLGGGAYDSLADLGRRGAPEVRLQRLHRALAAGAPLDTTERDTLRVEGQLGFRLGAGLAQRFVEAIYRTGRPGRLTGAWMAARFLASSLVRGRFAKGFYEPLPVTVAVDGDEWPPVPLYGLLCASVAEAGLGLKPFRRATEQPGFFEVLGLTAGPGAFSPPHQGDARGGASGASIWLSLELLRLLLGRPARRGRLLDAVAERVTLASETPLPYFLDGELRTAPGSLAITLGPRVTLVQA